MNDSSPVLENTIYSKEELSLIDPTFVPYHVAIVMDGNRRWAKKQGKSIEVGYCQGVMQLELVVRAAIELGIKALTLYSFSTENWKRTKKEVQMLMYLLSNYLSTRREVLVKERMCLHTIGDLSRLPMDVQKKLHEIKHATRNGNQIDLILALSYGGRDDVRRAFLKISEAVKREELLWSEVTEQTISSHLDTARWPDPDLFIRSGGVKRVSNFLIWQISYSEIVVLDTLWPDFSSKDLLQAVIEYQWRHRRFGG